MGGYGSTRWGWHSPKMTADSGLRLTMSTLIREGQIKPGLWVKGSLWWRNSGSGETVATISYESNMESQEGAYMRLQYNANGQPMDYRVALVTTRPHYGGIRWWFVCPKSGERAAKLFLPPGATLFASRSAYGLGYSSQREKDYERAMNKCQAIRMQLGGSGSMDDPFPNKPKGMWWRTYEKLREQAYRSERESWYGLASILSLHDMRLDDFERDMGSKRPRRMGRP
jgi:hypothetical protein